MGCQRPPPLCRFYLYLAAFALGLAACGHRELSSAEGSESPGSAAAPAQSSTGTIEGLVRLAEGASLPSYADHPMLPARAAAPLPSECSPPSEADRQPVRVGTSGGLTNLVVVATGDASRWPEARPPRTHRVRIENCRLTPLTLVAQRGDTIRFENPLTFPFFPDLGTGFSRALLPTDPFEMVLDQGGVRSVGCMVGNGCGRMVIVTIYHPIATVSDADGRFRLEGVPIGQEVRVTAWHPLFLEASATVRLERAGASARVELTIEPAPLPPPSSPPPVAPYTGDIPD